MPLFFVFSFPVAAQQVMEAPQPLTWTCRIVGGPRPAFLCNDTNETGSVQQADIRADLPPPSYAADLFASGAGANITRLTRSKPETYAGRTWAVPLFAPVIDEALGRQLAMAVMCGREPLCNVELARAPEALESVAAPQERISWPWVRARR